MTKGLVLAIDFDGTIASPSFPECGELIPYADLYINRLFLEGHTIIINTCRSGINEGLAQTFLEKHNINYHYINSNLPSLIEFYKQDCRKISADIYIDDKCLMGLPESWAEIYNKIQERWKIINKE